MSRFDGLVDKVNEMSKDYAMGNFLNMRSSLGGKRCRKPLFHNKGKYALHYGGRKELQLNIGIADTEDQYFRFGVAFSFENSQSYPNVGSTLRPKVNHFNDYMDIFFNDISDLKMWYHRIGDGTLLSHKLYTSLNTVCVEGSCRSGGLPFISSVKSLLSNKLVWNSRAILPRLLSIRLQNLRYAISR